jgi:hypothetical protein
MRKWLQGLAVLAGVVLLPAAAFAQAGIAGNVKDASGAVLPGVTVEAASPALIEKTRAVVTDGTGQYKIENLRPGTYSVTFTLPGFNTVKRDGVELTGSFVASINAEMKVGAVEETITVTGETPLVDIQNTSRQSVLTKEVIDAIPTGRTYSALAVLLPGVNSSGRDVGGATGAGMDSLTVHGGAAGDQRILQNGLNVMTLQTTGGNTGGMVPNQSAAQEVAIDTSGAGAERQTGGVAINYIQRDGGNSFKSYSFFTFGNESLASSNLTDRITTGYFGAPGVVTPGLTAVNSLKKTWEVNPGIGGPIKKDKLWFYYAARYQRAQDYAASMFNNVNAFTNPNSFTNAKQWGYQAGTQQALGRDAFYSDSQLRLTWQASPKNKFAGTYDQQQYCQCPDNINAAVAPEAARDRRFPVEQLTHAEWFSTVTSRLLVEFVGLHRTERWGNMDLRSSNSSPMFIGQGGGLDPAYTAAYSRAIGVTETTAFNGLPANLQYNGPQSTLFNNNWVPSFHFRGAVSYVTGAHSFKVGFQEALGYIQSTNYIPTVNQNGSPYPVRYIFKSANSAGQAIAANGGPTTNQVVAYASPYTFQNNQDHDFGLFAQDKWTMNRMTVNYGLRFDWFKSEYPDQTVQAADIFKNTTLARSQSTTLKGGENVNWKDITPRFGLSYDVKGDGKTAIKVSVNKYVQGTTANGNSGSNPVSALVNSAARTWTDKNGDFKVDCDLTNINANGECAALTANNALFGQYVPTVSSDPYFTTGWNKRGYNWEFSAGIQREILPRVSLDVSYFRRIYGNFTVTDNVNIPNGAAALQYLNQFSLVAPTDGRLDVASGETITGLYDTKSIWAGGTRCGYVGGPAVSAFPGGCNITANNVVTLVDGKNLNGANQYSHWNGVDFNANARLGAGITLRGGVSTGRTYNNNCEVAAQVPESLGNVPQAFCNTTTPFLTQVKAIASYTIPRVDLQVSGTFQSTPGPARQAVFTIDSTNFASATQSTLPNAPTGSGNLKTVNLLNEGQPIYGERLNQIDLRFGKLLKYGRTRTNVSVDVYNLLNKDTVSTENQAYESLYRPQTLIQARFVKFSAQFDF